jgi:hypothetical protein
MRNVQSLLELVGDTPLLQIRENSFLKLEAQNPTRSLSDRFVRHLLNDPVARTSFNIVRLDQLALSFIALSRRIGTTIRLDSNLSVDESLGAAGKEAVYQLCGATSSPNGMKARSFSDFVFERAPILFNSVWKDIVHEVNAD